MNVPPISFQIGKQGITPGVLEALSLAFKNHKTVRISVLKSSGRDRESIGLMADEITKGLKGRYGFRIIGFTIILKKLSDKPRKT